MSVKKDGEGRRRRQHLVAAVAHGNEEAVRTPANKGRAKKDEGCLVHAYGCTFVLAPAFSVKLLAEDALLMTAFANYRGLAIMVRGEVQPTARSEHAPLAVLSPMLGEDAQRCLAADNAGGASRISEALSVELLGRVFGAKLLKLEMELRYWPAHGCITDFSVALEKSGGCNVGVSVTRAQGAPGEPYTIEAAEALLRKKLSGVVRSSQTCLDRDEWTKQILHVWAPTTAAADAIEVAYGRLQDAELTSDTVVLVTLCSLRSIYEEKATPMGKKERAVKGLKDAQHLQALQESEPSSCSCWPMCGKLSACG